MTAYFHAAVLVSFLSHVGVLAAFWLVASVGCLALIGAHRVR